MMNESNLQKKIFFISVTDKKESLNRTYSNAILELLKRRSGFCNGSYYISRHDSLDRIDLYDSLRDAICSNEYEGYIVLLDCLDTQNGICNPNVMFEFGAIRYLNKPFAVIASYSENEFPFDVKNLNIEHIPSCVVEYIKKCYKEHKTCEIISHFFSENQNPKFEDDIMNFLEGTHRKYRNSLKSKKIDVQSQASNEKILEKIEEVCKNTEDMKELVTKISNTAEYIDGEADAFDALQEAVHTATQSLRTSRFANQTIVSTDTTEATEPQTNFMNSLYDTSKKLTRNFDRIICNNNPLKWNDIYNILFYGGNGSRVFVRKADYSIHFELVIIDKRIGFIHFYQQDHSDEEVNENSPAENRIEKINSTLKINGRSICKKLANIFDRLHHRDFDMEEPCNPSRTLLGVPVVDDLDTEYIKNGCFCLDDSYPEHTQYSRGADDKKRTDVILSMFKNAFETWPLDSKDRINMVIGIALLEKSDNYIKNVYNKNILSAEEYGSSIEKFKQLL